jgi:hypothetical protein
MVSAGLRLHGRGHDVQPCLGNIAQQVVQEVHPAALPGAALEHPLDRHSQPQVGVRDHQLGFIQAALLERAEELSPEALGLAVDHGNAEQFAVVEGVDANGHYDGPGADLHVPPWPAV